MDRINGEPRPASDRSIFDPALNRPLSILPEEDSDEAYCVRHDRSMSAVDPIIHFQGALYTTEDEFTVWTCSPCLIEVRDDVELEIDGSQVYRAYLLENFERWDQGDAPGDWFRYLGEGSIGDEGILIQ